jgi:hypothetical protein
MKRLTFWLFQLALLSVFVVPNSFRPFKAALFGVVLLVLLVRGRLRLEYDRRFAVALLVFGTSGVLFTVLGLFNGADDRAIPYLIAAYVAGPLLWTLLLAIYIRDYGLQTLRRTIVAGSLLASLLIVTYFFGFDSYPEAIKEALVSDPNVSFKQGIPATRLHAISTLLFAVPAYLFSIGSGRSPARSGRMRPSVGSSIVVVLALSAAAVVSGRSALLAVLATSLIFGPVRSNRGRLSLVAAGVIGYLVLPKLEVDIVATALSHFEKVSEGGGDERLMQQGGLLDGFAASPIIGHGHGVAAAVVRSDLPWRYELFFLGLLFHTGLIGFCAYLAPIATSLFSLRPSRHADAYLARFFMFGTFGVLVAGYTNPYLEGVESQWMVTIPWAIALLRSKNLSLDGAVPQASAPPAPRSQGRFSFPSMPGSTVRTTIPRSLVNPHASRRR